MENTYSIEEILSAVDDLQNNKKEKGNKNFKQSTITLSKVDIPKNTLRLIEEAEKNKN